ncbi:MAG: M48 family metallopeptidase [Candidatus Eutrophobiaceae bacterium]
MPAKSVAAQKIFTHTGGQTTVYQLVRSAKRRTLSIEVHPDAQVVVRSPWSAPLSRVEDALSRQSKWLLKKIAHFLRHPPIQEPRYVHGARHPFLGQLYPLRISASLFEETQLLNGQLLIASTNLNPMPAQVKWQLYEWYGAQAYREFVASIDRCLPLFYKHGMRVPRPRLSIRWMRSRWGSYMPRNGGSMSLNAHLIKAPQKSIDCVVVHELCHWKYHGHGVRFYSLMDKIMHDWREHDQPLKKLILNDPNQVISTDSGVDCRPPA